MFLLSLKYKCLFWTSDTSDQGEAKQVVVFP